MAQARALVFLKSVDICVGRSKGLLLNKLPSSYLYNHGYKGKAEQD